MDRTKEGSSEPALSGGATDGEASLTSPGKDPVSPSPPDNPANPAAQAPTRTSPGKDATRTPPGKNATRTSTGKNAVSPSPPDNPTSPTAQAPMQEAPTHPPTDVVVHGPGPAALPSAEAGHSSEDAGPKGQPSEIVRYGPGVPAVPLAGQAQLTAEHIWGDTSPAKLSRRRARLATLAGWTLTVILLAASGVLLFQRFHHVPLQVTGVAITQQTKTQCGVDVTGRITTNGSAGTVSYQWLIRPGAQPPQPLNQSVVAGQHAVYATVALEGQGHGATSQAVTLQVLGPEARAASAAVTVSCP